ADREQHYDGGCYEAPTRRAGNVPASGERCEWNGALRRWQRGSVLHHSGAYVQLRTEDGTEARRGKCRWRYSCPSDLSLPNCREDRRSAWLPSHGRRESEPRYRWTR